MRPDLIGHYLYGRLHGGVISASLDALGGLARTYLLAEAIIRRLADWIDPSVLHALLAHDLPLSLDDEASTRDSAARVQAAIGDPGAR